MSVTKMILEKAKELISEESKRTTGAFARDAEGNWISWDRPDAVCWCSIGAVLKVAKEEGVPDGRAYETLQLASRKMVDLEVLNSKDAIVYVNDHGTQAQVMQMFDLAIKDTP